MIIEELKERTHNARKRYIEVQPNAIGVVVGLASYNAIKSTPDYTDAMKDIIPEMIPSAVTITDNNDADGNLINHSVTVTTPWDVTQEMVDNPEDYAIVFYNKTTNDAAVTSKELAELAAPQHCAVLDIKNASTVFATVGGTVASLDTIGGTEYSGNFTHAILLKNNGYIDMAQLTDFSDEETADKIPTDNKDSGGYKSNIDGLKSADPGNVTGYYDPSFPSLATVNYAFDGGYTVHLRMGGIKKKFATYKTGTYKVSAFSTSGTADGSNALQYTAEFALQSGTLAKKAIV